MTLENASFAKYDGLTDGELSSRMKNIDDSEMLSGMLPHHSQFINEHDTIESQLSITAQIIRDVYNAKVGISILSQGDIVYLGVLTGESLTIQSFKMTRKRNLMKSRTQNY
ncbi:competence/damage-inducible protein A, partial [Staphylococcus aureus]|nr:competence/damage-inducible protein A [Staphylococcus aureus]